MREQAEARLAALERQQRVILDHVKFGFLVLDRTLRVQPGYARRCLDLFGVDCVEGADFGALLRPESQDAQLQLQLALEQVFDDLMPEALTLSQIPNPWPVQDKVLRIHGTVVRGAEGEVDALLITVEDITDLQSAEAQAQHNAALVTIMRQRPAFDAFLVESQRGLREAEGRIEDQPFVRRVVHTLKGNAASFGIDPIVRACHHAESAPEIDGLQLVRVRSSLRAFVEENAALLNSTGGGDAADIVLCAAAADELMQIAEDEGVPAILDWLRRVKRRPIRHLLGPLPQFVEQLARRLGKRVQLHIAGGHTEVNRQVFRPFLANLPHLIRNTLDHGIELPWERAEKPLIGSIELRVRESATHWYVSLADDGQGVNTQRLLQKAVAAGVVEPDAELSHAEMLELVFHDGLSSVERPSEYSGRGVGMAAVREAVVEVGGTIAIFSERGEGTRVDVTLPKSIPDLPLLARTTAPVPRRSQRCVSS